MNYDERQYNLTRLVIYVIGICFVFFVGSMTSCTMHNNAYESDVLKQEAAKAEVKSRTKVVQAKAIKELIDKGTHPVAANCAIMGWKENDSVCLAAGVRKQ